MHNQAFTIPSIESSAISYLEKGLVFQAVSSKQSVPILSFSMSPPSYHRRRLRNLVRFVF